MDISRQTALEILNLKDNFTTDELNKRYRQLCKLVHPDTGGDEHLFRLITYCKDLLKDSSYQVTSKQDSRFSSEQQAKTSCYVNLKTLEDIYYCLSDYLSNYDIIEIRTMVHLQITPRWRKKLCISKNIYLNQPFEQFQRAGFAIFSYTLSVPESLKKFKTFSIQVEFMGETYRFKLSQKKPVHIIKHENYHFNSSIKFSLE